MVEARANQAGNSGYADDQKSFVALALVPGYALELCAPAIELRLQHVRGDQQGCRNHQPEGRNLDRAKVQKRNHKRSTEYTHRRALAGAPELWRRRPVYTSH